MNKTEVEDRNPNMSEFVQSELTDLKLQQEILEDIRGDLADGPKNRAKKTERIRDELADGSKIIAREHERPYSEVSDGSKVEAGRKCDRSERESVKDNRERFRTRCLRSEFLGDG